MLERNYGVPNELMKLDDSLDRYIARLDLIGQKCCLKHAPEEYNIEQPDAVDYMCQYLGVNSEDSQYGDLLRIPICAECIQGLYSDDWALVYCVTCNSSQWIYKPDSKLVFHSDVVWLDECPNCTKKEE